MSRYIEWKAIEGYEGLYEVSNTGEIRNAKGKASWERALKYGIEHWNRRADNEKS